MSGQRVPDPLGSDPDRLLSYADIADLADVPERSVRKWAATSGLPVVALGRHRRVRAADWINWVAGRYVETSTHVDDTEAEAA